MTAKGWEGRTSTEKQAKWCRGCRNEKRKPPLEDQESRARNQAPTQWLEGSLRASPGPEVRGQAKGAVNWEEPVPPSLHFPESNQQSARGNKTDCLAVYLAERQASPTGPRVEVTNRVTYQTSGQISNVYPHMQGWSSPSPSSQEQGADVWTDTTPYFPPTESKGPEKQ